MKRLKKLLKDNSGESMTELIVSFTIFMLALAVLTSMVTLGLKFNRMAADADKAYYSEYQTAKTTLTVSIENIRLDDSPTSTITAPKLLPIQYYFNEAGFIYFQFDEPDEPEESGEPEEPASSGGDAEP